MSVSQGDAAAKSRFRFLLCIDLVVFVSILVIAGRPEALAITVSAVIVCAIALLYRGTVGVKSYMANAAAKKAARRNAARQPSQVVRRPPAAAAPVKSTSKSWLRDSE